jgi:hypothetical protein
MSGKGYGRNQYAYSTCDISAGSQTEHFPNSSVDRYRYANPLALWSLGRQRRRCENNVELDFNAISCEDAKLIRRERILLVSSALSLQDLLLDSLSGSFSFVVLRVNVSFCCAA